MLAGKRDEEPWPRRWNRSKNFVNAMAQSQVRLKCPSCHQNLRLVNVPADKKSIRCPLCSERVSLSLHQRAPSVDVEVIEEAEIVEEGSSFEPQRRTPRPARRSAPVPSPRPSTPRNRRPPAAEEILLEPDDDPFRPPRAPGRRKKKKRKAGSFGVEWTFSRVLRALFSIPFVIFGILAIISLFIGLVRAINGTVAEGAIQMVFALFALMFHSGVTLALWNFSNDDETRMTARLLYIPGCLVMVLTFFAAMMFGMMAVLLNPAVREQMEQEMKRQHEERQAEQMPAVRFFDAPRPQGGHQPNG